MMFHKIMDCKKTGDECEIWVHNFYIVRISFNISEPQFVRNISKEVFQNKRCLPSQFWAVTYRGRGLGGSTPSPKIPLNSLNPPPNKIPGYATDFETA